MELPQEQKDIINSMIKDQFGIDDENIKNETQFSSDLGLDSLDFVELIIEVEIEFGISIPGDTGLLEAPSIGKFYEVVATSLKAKK